MINRIKAFIVRNADNPFVIVPIVFVLTPFAFAAFCILMRVLFWVGNTFGPPM